jgi:hypothetical protein
MAVQVESLSESASFTATQMVYTGSSVGFVVDPHVGQVGFGVPLLHDRRDAVCG